MALAMAPAEYTMADPGNGYVIHVGTRLQEDGPKPLTKPVAADLHVP